MGTLDTPSGADVPCRRLADRTELRSRPRLLARNRRLPTPSESIASPSNSASAATTATTRRPGSTSTPSARRESAENPRPGRRSSGSWSRVRCRRRGAIDPASRRTTRVDLRHRRALDRAAAEQPDPGRTDTFRRLNRTEYQNAIRDLLALDIDAIGAAAGRRVQPRIRQRDGGRPLADAPGPLHHRGAEDQPPGRRQPGPFPGGDTIRIRPDLTQEEHVEGLPIGTRGGALIPYTFPQDGEYEIQLRLARDRNEHVEGLREPHELEVLLDRERKASFTVTPPRSETDHQTADAHLKARIRATAGPHKLGVTFLKNPSSLLETKRQPYQAHYNMHRHPRISPALYQVSITGPYRAEGHGDTPSRRRIFVCEPKGPSDEEACARRILATLMRRAYRRPVTDADLRKPMELYRQARAEGDFDAGIEMALSAVLVNPQFLFRIEAGPARRRAATRPIASPTSSSRPACRSSSGAASRTTSCSTWPSAAS